MEHASAVGAGPVPGCVCRESCWDGASINVTAKFNTIHGITIPISSEIRISFQSVLIGIPSTDILASMPKGCCRLGFSEQVFSARRLFSLTFRLLYDTV
jgi:hypothetical protein